LNTIHYFANIHGRGYLELSQENGISFVLFKLWVVNRFYKPKPDKVEVCVYDTHTAHQTLALNLWQVKVFMPKNKIIFNIYILRGQF
jgi:hypothetical protein